MSSEILNYNQKSKEHQEKRTSKYMTKYEKSRILGTRSITKLVKGLLL